MKHNLRKPYSATVSGLCALIAKVKPSAANTETKEVRRKSPKISSLRYCGFLDKCQPRKPFNILKDEEDEEDALTILSTLRKGLSCRQTEVDNSTAVPVSNDDDKPTPQEWQIQNPIAYPGTAGRDTNLFQKDPYRGLTKSPGHDFHADT
jgi:hypothetical protein